MFFTQKKTPRRASAAKPMRKLHSIHTLLRERTFIGELEAGNAKYGFTFAPQAAAVNNRRLELTGSVTVTTPGSKTNTADNVRATLAAAQGAMGSARQPRAFQLITPSTYPDDPRDGKPLTEYTASRSSVGVVYFHLSPLDGKALGLPFDLSKLQLNGRLAVIDETARDLQWLFSQAYAALAGEQPDAQLAEPYVTELNRLLSA
jgi:hypothetical protein